jgi:molybdenum cofactor cytidylyltransferase
MTLMQNCENPRKLVSALVLAAGTSSRMGEAKQLLPLGATTILARTLENTCAAALHEVILVLGCHAESIRKQLRDTLLQRTKVIVNPFFEQGIASSLRAGLSAVDPASGAALIVLGDQPFVRPETLAQIVETYHRSQAEIVVPIYQGQRGNPALLGRSVFKDALALTGDTGFRAIFPKYLQGIVNVEVEDSGVVQDIDSAADYQRLSPKI